jgi:hypothetical protein
MGRYSRKDMIEFAKFAKSYQSSRNVEEAYQAYLKGQRLVSHKSPSMYRLFMRANKVFVDGMLVKSRFSKEQGRYTGDFRDIGAISWDGKNRILKVKTI